MNPRASFWFRSSILTFMCIALIVDRIYNFVSIEKTVYGVLITVMIMLASEFFLYYECLEKKEKDKRKTLLG